MSISPAPFAIERLPVEQLDAVEPLWSALREHHGAVLPQLGPLRSREASWALRRRQYVDWLSDPDAFVLVARRTAASEPVAYALVYVKPSSPTWDLGERTGMLETLAVLPEARGAGLGTAMLARVREELRPLGITGLHLDVIVTNAAALRFYEREGFAPFATAMRSTFDA